MNNSDGGTYRGQWHYNERHERWEGNPANAAEVTDVLTAVKHKSGAEGGDRTHSLAMSKEYMERMLQWSEGKVSTRTVEQMMKDPDRASVAERSTVTKHLEFRAFVLMVWTVWSR